MQTLLNYASYNTIVGLLAKERVKYLRKNKDDRHNTLELDCPIEDLASRRQLSRMMPPRSTWVRPRRRHENNDTANRRKNAVKAIIFTIRRDRRLQKKEGIEFRYLDELDSFVELIQNHLADSNLSFQSPTLVPIYKEHKIQADGSIDVTCRPLSVYTQLKDKIILALASRYLTRLIDSHLHPYLLSYRPPREFNGMRKHITDFNDGIRLVENFRQRNNDSPIYAADCDIMKFYDIIPHDTVRRCFADMLEQCDLSGEGREQVMRIINAYLNSYNFYTNAWLVSQESQQIFYKIRRQFAKTNAPITCRIKWVDSAFDLPPERQTTLGVSQGGALSLIVANVVLNHVDTPLLANHDPNRLFVRYCDDMLILHTNLDECHRLINAYAESLRAHGLQYHPFSEVSSTKDGDKTRSDFWHIKSHSPYLWGEGEGNSNRYVGFLGYELRRDGRIRLRKGNMERFHTKFQRKYHALQRFRKKKPEEYASYHKRTFDTLLSGLDYYQAFDKTHFFNGAQYRYLIKERERLRNVTRPRATIPNNE